MPPPQKSCCLCGFPISSGSMCSQCRQLMHQAAAAGASIPASKPVYKCMQCGAPLYTSYSLCGACVSGNKQYINQQNQQGVCGLCGKSWVFCSCNQKQQFYCVDCGIASVASNGTSCIHCTLRKARNKYSHNQQNFCPICGFILGSCVCKNKQPKQQNQQQPKGATNVAISCRIYWDDAIQGYAVSCSYKPDFITFLKTNIPASDRAFHPNTKVWTFHEKYFEVIKKAAEMVFGPGSVSALPRSTKTSSSTPVGVGSSADPLTLAFAKFARLLPHDVLKKAYREAASALHPDKQGGDARRMSDLNEVWSQIKVTLP